MMVQKQVKIALNHEKRKRTEELRVFKKACVSNSDQESMNNSSSEEGEVCKLSSVELYAFINNHCEKNLKQHKESF